jgi:hypothetical protein
LLPGFHLWKKEKKRREAGREKEGLATKGASRAPTNWVSFEMASALAPERGGKSGGGGGRSSTSTSVGWGS